MSIGVNTSESYITFVDGQCSRSFEKGVGAHSNGSNHSGSKTQLESMGRAAFYYIAMGTWDLVLGQFWKRSR